MEKRTQVISEAGKSGYGGTYVKRKKILQYLQLIPDAIKYQVITKVILFILVFLIEKLAMWMIYSTGRVAISSGDFLFVFATWQGWVLIGTLIAVFFFYTAMDLNVKIIYCTNIIKGEEDRVGETIRKAFLSMRHFINPRGLLVIIFVALVFPILGITVSISLTSGFYIPNFITAVIYANPIFLVLYFVGLGLLLWFSIKNIFLLHEVVIDNKSVKQGAKDGRRLQRENRGKFIKHLIMAIVLLAIFVGAAILITMVLPLGIISATGASGVISRTFVIFFYIFGGILSAGASALVTPFFMLRLTQMYEEYKEGEKVYIPVREKKKHTFLKYVAAVFLIGCLSTSIIFNVFFERVFPLETNVSVIAHRGGGDDGVENTVQGLKTAISLGAMGSEIDVQRTKDGYFIINHDNDFKRLTGTGKKPGDMTLAEIKELVIKTAASEKGEPVATFEEMLDAARGQITLFVELKGSSADIKMADDLVRMIKEKGMENETVLISLKYDIIDYIESKYPEMNTGFLTWASYGDMHKLNCDWIGFEEESATRSAIAALHDNGKKCMVWTVNSEESVKHFLISDADAIITDKIELTNRIIEELLNRDDTERIGDMISSWL
ncbi:MAG: glycerophosphoryl diester phosphodiesterase membrane domain-containing protein [Lachnospiraceae bacterium]|nr:glycerophosphoryl diester phosphodiesterase membrane domain-containing protein [Lachnospiraceae bacterium]